MQTQLLTGQPVRFTLGQAKLHIPQQDRTGLASEVINLIPVDVGFTVLLPQQAPQLYTAIDVLKTLWLWVGLLGLAALIGALALSRRRRRTLRARSVTTAVLGLLLVIAVRVAQGPLLIHVKPANAAAATAIYEGGWVKPERPACSPTTSSLHRRPTCWRHRHRIRDQPGPQRPPGVGSSMSRPPAGDATAAAARTPGPPEAQPGSPGWTAEAMSGQPDLPDQWQCHRSPVAT